MAARQPAWSPQREPAPDRALAQLPVAVDHERVSSGSDIRWRNSAARERYAMVKEGLMKADSLRRIWELTSAGVEAAEREANR